MTVGEEEILVCTCYRITDRWKVIFTELLYLFDFGYVQTGFKSQTRVDIIDEWVEVISSNQVYIEEAELIFWRYFQI